LTGDVTARTLIHHDEYELPVLSDIETTVSGHVPGIHANGPALWIGEDEVASLVSLSEVIAAIRGAYRRAAAGEIVAMPKTYASWNGGTVHAIGAVATSTGLAVSKTWAHTRGGATPLLAAWDTATGRLHAVIQAFALGQLRTSAISGAATSILAAERCARLGVIGSGKQAEGQVAAVAAVRDVGSIAVYSPTAQHRVAFAERIVERSGIETLPVDSVAEAVDQADVVVTVTRATEPFIGSSMLANRVHINAVGGITPERAELEPAVVARARRIVADDVAAARQLAPRELSAANAPHVVSLGAALLANDRLDGRGITIFKALGSGISDLAVAELVIERAGAANVGRALPVSAKSQPKMWSA
jgi:ornithine cyclodeaminase/alanine dehydrogenase-like protein (mu-crystallin family)